MRYIQDKLYIQKHWAFQFYFLPLIKSVFMKIILPNVNFDQNATVIGHSYSPVPLSSAWIIPVLGVKTVLDFISLYSKFNFSSIQEINLTHKFQLEFVF